MVITLYGLEQDLISLSDEQLDLLLSILSAWFMGILSTLELNRYVPYNNHKPAVLPYYRYFLGISFYVIQVVPTQQLNFSLGLYVRTQREAESLLLGLFDKSCYIGVVIDRVKEQIVYTLKPL